MQAVDFITVFGRLLQDGALRDEFRESPASLVHRLQLSHIDESALLQLDPDDLEFQAVVLLRKRFAEVKRMLPVTCQSLGTDAWPRFLDYSRCFWPQNEKLAHRDAHEFCVYLAQKKERRLSSSEKNRLRFSFTASKFSIHWVSDLLINNRPRHALQILVRTSRGRCREFALSL